MNRSELETIFRDQTRLDRIKTLEPIRKLSTHQYGCILNYFVENMKPGECYLDVGCWAGFSLFAGAIGNLNKKCIGVDNFSEAQGFSMYIEDRLDKFPNITFHEMDYHDYFNFHNDKIGFYHYDADHTVQGQYDNLVLAKKVLQKDSITIIDDWNWKDVQYGTKQFLKENDDFEVIFEEETNVDDINHQELYNGICIIRRN